MLMKSLIGALVLSATLASNGHQDPRQIPVTPPPPAPPEVETALSVGEGGEELREEFHQTYNLSPTGRVSLENINGGVQIKIWDRSAVQVDAVKKAYRRDRLNEARIEVNATEENIRIKTEYPDRDQYFRSDRYDNPAKVEYTLTV